MICPACNHPRATLPDGRRTCTWSEDWRAHCEALRVCAIPTLEDRRRYLLEVRNKRGEQAQLQLRADVALIWNAKKARPEVATNTGS